MKEIYVKTLMNETVTCLKQETPLRDAIKQMVENEISCTIIEQDGNPLGIVTERDLVKILNSDLDQIDLSRPISEFMTSPVLLLKQDETLFDALVVSKAGRVRHLPVVGDDEKLVGLVTQSDLADAHYHVTELQAERIEKAITDKVGELQNLVGVLQNLNEELQALSMEDHLMEIGNRRAMEVDLEHIHASALRYKDPYSVLLIDVDKFKLYNDHYGHQMGDDVLKRVATILKANIRKSDRLYRYGGEELLVVLPHINSEQLEFVSAKLIRAIAVDKMPHEKSNLDVVTISGGAANVMNGGTVVDRWETLVEIADQCLYKAKESGRNQSIVASRAIYEGAQSPAEVVQLNPRLTGGAKSG